MGGYKRPTMKLVRHLQQLNRETRSFFWLEGFRAGRRSVEKREDAANALALRSVREHAKLARQVRLLSHEVFVRNGATPYDPPSARLWWAQPPRPKNRNMVLG